ncbi:MAG: prolyl oligopeptidase family serine peptidase [Chitinophagaceae bacterium]
MKAVSTFLLGIFSLVGSSFFAFSQAPKEKIKVTDLALIKTAGNVQLNKDGSLAVFTVLSVEPEADNKWEYKYNTQLYLANTNGKQVVKQLSFKENSSQPAFSPSGNEIAFVRTVEGKPQIFVLPLDGGEARQVTKFKYGASNPQWSGNGEYLYFNSSISFTDLLKDKSLKKAAILPEWNIEKPGINKQSALIHETEADPNGSIAAVRAYLMQNEKDKKAKVITKLNFQEEGTTSSEMYFNHFFKVAANGTTAPEQLTTGFYQYNQLQELPNKNSYVFAATLDSVMHPERVLNSKIFIYNHSNQQYTVLLGSDSLSFTNPQVSPQGDKLAFFYSKTGFLEIPELGIISLNKANSSFQTIKIDRTKGTPKWSEDGKFLYTSIQSNGGNILAKIEIATGKINVFGSVDEGITSFDVCNNLIAYSLTKITNPSEVLVSNTNWQQSKQLTQQNTDWLANKALSLPVKDSFVNSNGLMVEYWVMKPTTMEAGKKYPLLLEIHGGPSAMWGPGEASMWHEFQYFCSQGYGVVYANPRGSGGYGKEFLRANMNDWGKGPTEDVLTALDKAVAQGWVDTSKLLVSGGSYAGYLVSWIIAHDQRFKAACSQRGVYDLRTFFGEGNAWRLVPNYFGGYPWEAKTKEILERESPINYVTNIKTPYIIFHGENDLRTGVIQSEMLYKSLKVLGRPVEYVRHPGATHEITRSGNNRQRIDQMLRTYEFFERWLNH